MKGNSNNLQLRLSCYLRCIWSNLCLISGSSLVSHLCNRFSSCHLNILVFQLSKLFEWGIRIKMINKWNHCIEFSFQCKLVLGFMNKEKCQRHMCCQNIWNNSLDMWFQLDNLQIVLCIHHWYIKSENQEDNCNSRDNNQDTNPHIV